MGLSELFGRTAQSFAHRHENRVIIWTGNFDIQNKIYDKENNELLWAKTEINNQITEEVKSLMYNAPFMTELFSYLFKAKDKLTVRL